MHQPSTLASWPWRSSTTAGLVTLGLMAALYAGEPARGIALASATNMAAVAFFLVGGIGASAGPRPESSWPRFVVASLVGAAIAAVLCWVVVVILRVVILPREPFAETLLEDGFGRAVIVFEGSSVAGIVVGSLRRIAHRVTARRAG